MEDIVGHRSTSRHRLVVSFSEEISCLSVCMRRIRKIDELPGVSALGVVKMNYCKTIYQIESNYLYFEVDEELSSVCGRQGCFLNIATSPRPPFFQEEAKKKREGKES